jgi:alpha-mannosidase
MVYLGGLWPGYVSPAHSCRVADRAEHDPIELARIQTGHMYSSVFANNFGTNFYATQPGSYLFRYSITTAEGASDALAARFGQEALTPCECIFTDRPREGRLPPVHGNLRLEGDGVVLLACKRAEDGRGHIIRLWNCTQQQAQATVTTSFSLGALASLTDAVERDLGDAEGAELLHSDETGFSVRIDPGAIATVRTATRTAR